MEGEDSTIILPTINEAENISKIIDSLKKECSEARIVVVDDGSSDGTQEIAQEKGAHVIDRSNKPSGLTGSVLDALKAYKSEKYLVMDADGQHPPEKVPELLDKLRHCDISIACRGNTPGLSAFRKTVAYSSKLIANLGLQFRGKERRLDPLTGFFAFRKNIAEFMLKNRKSFEESGLKILYDLLKLNPGFTIAEMGFNFEKRISGKSKAGFDYFVIFLRQVAPDEGMLRKLSEQYIKPEFARFSLVGALGVLVNLLVLWTLTEFAGLYCMISAAIAIELTIMENFIFNYYWTFGRRKFRHGFWKCCLETHGNRAAGLFIKMGSLVVLVEFAGIWYIFSMIIGIVLAWLWHFFWAERFIFASEQA